MAEDTLLNIDQPHDGIDTGGYDKLTHLEPCEQVRLRPGMYIGKLGDGSQPDDGIYVLFKEVVDNSIDEFNTGYAKPSILIDIDGRTVTIRDFGRGIPLEQVKDASSLMNTSGKYDSSNYKRSVGLNGVGIKAANFLSTSFYIRSVRGGMCSAVEYAKGKVLNETGIIPADEGEENGTLVRFTPDPTIFNAEYQFREDILESMVRNYSYLNTGLSLYLNGRKYHSRYGLLDLLKENMTSEPLYPPMRFVDNDIEVVITHANQVGEEFYSYVNSQYTPQGGTHQSAFREAISRTIKEYYQKNFEYSDIRNGIVAAVSIKVGDPVFESQTKIKLGSTAMWKDGPTIYKFISDYIKKQLDDYLHKTPATSDIMLKKIQESERQRKAIAGVTKQVRERAKKAALHNDKLRDCRVHLSDARPPKGYDYDRRDDSCIFITEGLSASGSITKIRDVETQAVFSLRGKPLNTYALEPKKVYTNEEFALLQAALDIDDGIDGLRYNKVIIATDADVDGMHIRLLMLTYFLQFYPELIKTGHLYILQTPLFRVLNKKDAKRKAHRSAKKEVKKERVETYYCYTDDERIDAINRLGENAEITRFKGLGEISPEEFKDFIGPDMRLDRVTLHKGDSVKDMLAFYMGKNTMERQRFIIDNLVIEDDEDITIH